MLRIRTHLRLALKSPRATINAVFYSEENRQGIILINQCAILKLEFEIADFFCFNYFDHSGVFSSENIFGQNHEIFLT